MGEEGKGMTNFGEGLKSYAKRIRPPGLGGQPPRIGAPVAPQPVTDGAEIPQPDKMGLNLQQPIVPQAPAPTMSNNSSLIQDTLRRRRMLEI
jgi:hypothetical protein